MAQSFKFELVSPERLLLSEEVESVVIPGTEGEMTVMAGHAPVMSTIKPGVVTVTTTAGAKEQFVVFGGFADILPDSCTVLAESAMRVQEVDKNELNRRIELARQDVENARDDRARTKAEEFLAHLTTLGGDVVWG
jgi:F-type H+-transporting ATPase subunit epsilon